GVLRQVRQAAGAAEGGLQPQPGGVRAAAPDRRPAGGDGVSPPGTLFSPGGASDGSPGRQPWGQGPMTQAPEGRRSAAPRSVAPPGLSFVGRVSQGFRPALPSDASPGLSPRRSPGRPPRRPAAPN